MDLKISKATPEEVKDLTRVYEEARIFKQSKRDNAWGDEPFTAKDIGEMMQDNYLYVAKTRGQVAGSFMLTPKDTYNWDNKVGDDKQAYYIHLLATGTDFRGQGIGRQIIAWASDCARKEGRKYVRLNCSYKNRGLCNYYETLGVQEVARKNFESGYPAALYQLTV